MRSRLKKCNSAELRKLIQTDQNPAATVQRVIDLQRAWLMVNRAARAQGKPTLCLPRSIVLASMLRNRGYNALVKIGVDKAKNTRSIDFFAHAWVEVNGDIIGEKASVENRFLALI